MVIETRKEDTKVFMDEGVGFVVRHVFYREHEGERKRHTAFYVCGSKCAADTLVKALTRD